jgi:hypothetical protein
LNCRLGLALQRNASFEESVTTVNFIISLDILHMTSITEKTKSKSSLVAHLEAWVSLAKLIKSVTCYCTHEDKLRSIILELIPSINQNEDLHYLH